MSVTSLNENRPYHGNPSEGEVWSKSCIGPGQTADSVSRALINYEAQLQGGCVLAIERAGGRTRYKISTFMPDSEDFRHADFIK